MQMMHNHMHHNYITGHHGQGLGCGRGCGIYGRGRGQVRTQSCGGSFVTRMVTATIWENIVEHQDKIAIPLLPSKKSWEEAQHIAFVSHQNYKMVHI